MTTPRKDIAEEFNATASGYLDKDVSDDLLLAKFGLQLRFRAQSVEEKEQLAAALFDCAHEFLERRASPGFSDYIGNSDIESVSRLLSRLAAADTTPLLPARAPGQLADIGMKFVEAAEKASDSVDRRSLTALAELCLTHAEAFKDIIDKRSEDITTSKTITPARRIVLKKDDAP